MSKVIPDILKKILDKKREEIFVRSREQPISKLVSRVSNQPAARGFVDALLKQINLGKSGVIAEIKKASPSKGVIRDDFDPRFLAQTYEDAGATCISVLTDKEFFHGATDDLIQARSACSIPVIRKDFIIDPYQIFESRIIGADAILLIVAALDQGPLIELTHVAKEVGLDILLEVHNHEELERALEVDTDIIGINNRDLRSFATELQTTIKLLPHIPDGKVVVTESGISSYDDVSFMWRQGVRGFLVGEVMMKADNPAVEFKNLFEKFI